MFIVKVTIDSRAIYSLLNIPTYTLIKVKCICTDGDVICFTIHNTGRKYSCGVPEIFVTTDFTIECVYEHLKLTIPVQINKHELKPIIISLDKGINYSLTAI